MIFKNIRFWILSFSILTSISIYYWVKSTIPDGSLQIIRYTELYALIAVSLLWLTLMIGPSVYLFKFLPFRGHIFKARRAIGVSVFYFGVLHAYFAFFGELGGFAGLGFLSNQYLIGISLSFTALLIFSVLASTSFDFMVRWLTFGRWKFIHRFIYIASFLILIHALMLGVHFQDLSTTIPKIFFAALVVLLLLEANRFDAFLQGKFTTIPKFGFSVLFIVGLAVGVFFYADRPGGPSLGIHAEHIHQAQLVAQGQTTPINTNDPTQQGDRTKKFNVDFDYTEDIPANEDVTLDFKVYDGSNGNPVAFFDIIYEKISHLVVVDSELAYFDHIHPAQNANGFSIQTKFPKDGIYHLYLNYQPKGAVEQQVAFTVNVGGVKEATPSAFVPDENMSKTFGQYQVTLSGPKPLKAEQMTVGSQSLTFTIKDAKSKKDITSLKPYLSSFGHLVMINADSYDYIHVHPSTLTPPPPDANGGPSVDFLPLGLYGPIKPGIYRVFGQFNPDGKLFVSDYTVKVE